MPSSDWKVEIVDANGDPDYSVSVVGDIVVDIAGATDGEVLTVQADGTVAAEAPASQVAQTITNGVTATAPSQDAVFDALALKAPLASPALTGNPTAPTQSAGDNSTKLATTAYADAKVVDSIADADTTHAPSRNAVFDALALKASVELSMIVGATRFNGLLGTPALTGSHAVAWLLDATSVERVGAAFIFPPDWATYHVDFLWYNAGAGSGDVVWRHFRYQMEVGDNMSSNAADGSVQATGTAGLQNILVKTRLVTGQAVPAAGIIKTMVVDRFATDSGDTLGNDAAFVGMLLTRAS